jgi:hypothetical protein
VIIWNAQDLNNTEKASAKALADFVISGGRMLVLSSRSWNWPEFGDITMTRSGPYSRVFSGENINNHTMMKRIDPDYFIRWNGLPGTVAIGDIKFPKKNSNSFGPSFGLSQYQIRNILWAGKPDLIVTAEVVFTEGKGSILFSQLDIQNHIDNSASNYDPAAEKILINMLNY